MKIKQAYILTLITLLSFFPVHAKHAHSQEVLTSLFGLGLSSCGVFLTLTSPEKDPAGYALAAYSRTSEGILSGISMLTTVVTHQTTKAGLKMDGSQRMAWLNARCRKDPTEGFSNANLALWNFIVAHHL
mgnify:CR=1 FL=1